MEALTTLGDIRSALHRLRSLARVGETATEGVTVENEIEPAALFDSIAQEVDVLLKRTEFVDGTGEAPRARLDVLAREVGALRRRHRHR